MTVQEQNEMHDLARSLEKLTSGTGWSGMQYFEIGKVMQQLSEYCAVEPTWLPISTAPHDGKRVLISYQAGYGPRVVQAVFKAHAFLGVGMQDYWECDIGKVSPTHWMPLPSPPSILIMKGQE